MTPALFYLGCLVVCVFGVIAIACTAGHSDRASVNAALVVFFVAFLVGAGYFAGSFLSALATAGAR